MCLCVPVCPLVCEHACPCVHVQELFKRRDIWLYCVHLSKWSKWFEHWALEQTGTTELTFAILYRLSVYWKKDNLAYWTHSPWRANCYGNEHHTLRELQCPLSCCSGGWKRIWPTRTHRHARTHTERGREKRRKVEEREREQTHISRPHKPVNKICGADKL